MTTIIALLGVAGAGKTTLLKMMKDVSWIKILVPSTTRERRPGEDEYHFIQKPSWRKPNFAWTIEAKGNLYGMRKSQIEEIPFGRIGLTVFYPGSIQALFDFRETTDIEIVTVGLNTIASHEELKDRIGSDTSRDEGIAAFEEQRKVVSECDVVLSGDEDTVFEALKAVVRALSKKGVLDGDCIKALIKAGALLQDADLKNVQSASYDLRVGETYWCKGQTQQIHPDSPISIPPYSYVIAQARECAILPNFVTAHYDLKVSLFVEGIVLSNGPQVDPGFSGALLCMLFNGSDSNVGLKKDEHFATIEFLITNRVTRGYEQQHQDQKKLGQFMLSSVQVRPGGTILEQLNDLRSEWRTFRNVFMVAGLALLVGSGSLIATLGKWAYETAEKSKDLTIRADDLLKRVEMYESPSLISTNSRSAEALQRPASTNQNQSSLEGPP